MHWHKWPYWLRGGVIGGGIALFLTILGFSCEAYFDFKYPGGLPVLCLPFEIVWVPTFILPGGYIASVLFWFLVGSFVGVIVEKIKSKKKSSS
jgi:hypothetical protein